MKIGVLGASVSHQTIHHVTKEITGYVEVLRRNFAEQLGVTEIRQFTYEGNRLSDGGLIRLEEVVAYQPDICLFEPLIEDGSRGKNSLLVEKRYVYMSLLEANILPVTLLLPEPFGRPACNIPHYNQFIAISRQYGLPIIEVDIAGLSDLEAKFRCVHTRFEGAMFYAQEIIKGLQCLTDPHRLAAEALVRALEWDRPEVVVSPLPLPSNPAKRITKMKISLRSDSPDPIPFRLVQRQNIGVFSPVLNLMLMRGNEPVWSESLSVWDPFCHHTRLSYVLLADTVLKQKGDYVLQLQLSKKIPDYSLCRRSRANWPEKLYLEPTAAPVLISYKPISASVTLYQ